MSTKAIRVALNYLETITASGYFGHEALVEFKAEVEAIEKAAKPIVEKVRLNDIVHEMPDHCPLMITLPAGVWRALVKAVGP